MPPTLVNHGRTKTNAAIGWNYTSQVYSLNPLDQIQPQLTVQHVLYYKCTRFVPVRECIVFHHMKITPLSLNYSIKTHIPPVILSMHHTYYTIFTVFFPTHSMYLITHQSPFLFTPRHRQGDIQYCYHTHTAFIDTTSVTAWGMCASAQTANHLLLALMKSPQRGHEPRSGVRRGGFALSASDLPCIDSWKKGRVPRMPLSIWPHPPHLFFPSIFHLTIPQPGKVEREFFSHPGWVCTCVCSVCSPAWAVYVYVCVRARDFKSWKSWHRESRQLSPRIYIILC